MTDLITYPDLTEVAEAHLRLMTSLDQLADRDGESARRQPSNRGDQTPIGRGDVVVVRASQRWRHGIVTELGVGGKPASLRVAYLIPTALDAAQRTWGAAGNPMLEEDYPRQQADIAAAEYRNDVTAGPEAARLAYHRAYLARVVAQRLTRRPWAAVVPVQYTDVFTTKVFLADDQTLHNR